MTPVMFSDAKALKAAVGSHLGPSTPMTIGQEMIDAFAAATGDDQWIHVDPERAAEGPYGATIAHGYLTLALSPVLSPRLFVVEGTRMSINYGLDKVRFPAPLLSGTAVVVEADLLDAMELPDSGIQLKVRLTTRPEQEGKPVCVAEQVRRYYW